MTRQATSTNNPLRALALCTAVAMTTWGVPLPLSSSAVGSQAQASPPMFPGQAGNRNVPNVTINQSMAVDHTLHERPDLFTPTSKTWQHYIPDGRPTGTFTLHTSVGPIQYQDAHGTWHEIDTTLVPTSVPGFTHETASTEYRLLVNQDTLAYRYYPKQAREEYLEERLPQIGVGLVEGNSLRAASPLQNLMLSARPEGTKFELLLKERGAPLSYTTPMKLHGVTIEDGNGAWAVRDTEGNTVAYLRTPFAFDASDPPMHRDLAMV